MEPLKISFFTCWVLCHVFITVFEAIEVFLTHAGPAGVPAGALKLGASANFGVFSAHFVHNLHLKSLKNHLLHLLDAL